jgi:hypothetical protein
MDYLSRPFKYGSVLLGKSVASVTSGNRRYN